MQTDFKTPQSSGDSQKEKVTIKRQSSSQQVQNRKLPCLGEDKEFVGDPSAVNKDGYVHRGPPTTLHPASSLAHLSYFCPGLHGKGTKQDIRRRTFHDILKDGRYIIPMIQRRYCWENNLIYRWYSDIRRGTRDHLGIHNTGNLVVKWSQSDKGYVLIDGQQRVTTSLLFLAALRDVVLELLCNEEKDRSSSLVDRIEEMLNVQGRDGTDRLVPCHLDRESFFSIMRRTPPSDTSSFQVRCVTIFQSLLKDDIVKIKHMKDKIDLAEEIFYQSVHKMGVTFVHVLNEINLGQVFVWLQEKSILADDLVHNSSPGLGLFTCDLVRNLLLSPILDHSLQEQEEFYVNQWLNPLEGRFSGRNEFNAGVKKYIEWKHSSSLDPSSLETQLAKAPNTGNKIEIICYSKFVTIHQDFQANHPCDSLNPGLIKSLSMIEDMKQFFFDS